MTKIDDMREAFEAWEATPEGDFATHEDGFYAGYKAAKASHPDVEALIAEIYKHVNNIPVGKYIPTKGDSAYNWGKHFAAEFSDIIRKWAKGEV